MPVWAAGRGQCGGGTQEALHRRTGGMDDEGERIGCRLVPDGVPTAAGQRYRLASGRCLAVDVAVLVLNVDLG